MHPEMETIPCSIVRGGTSKAIFLMENELPGEQAKRDDVIRAIYGSPDIRQIDGLGGADILTSKLAIIGPPTVEWADVDYTFGQVSFETDIIDYAGNCGNISSAVGPYAIDEGLVRAIEPVTIVKIHMTNSGQMLIAEVPVEDGRAKVTGDFEIDGVPGTGAKITLDWSKAVDSSKLMPTGNPQEIFEIDGKKYAVSLLNVGNPHVFIEAKSLGMKGTESPQEIEADKTLMETVEKIRSRAAVIFGLVDRAEDAAAKSPYAPFFAIVSPPTDYDSISKKRISKNDIDIVSRLLFMLRMHKAYPVTGTVCTGAAARIPGSIVYNLLDDTAKNDKILRIGHPAGVIPVESVSEIKGNEVLFHRLGVYRTARKIMDGLVYVKKSVFK